MIVKMGHYDPTNLASVAWHFGQKGEDGPVLALLEQGADPNTIGGFNNVSALHYAVTLDRPTAVCALLEAGADPNRFAKSSMTPLMSAKSVEVARLLLAAGADVNAVTLPTKPNFPAGSTALMSASKQGKADIVAVLIAYKADMHLRDAGGYSALMWAAQEEQSAIVRLLQESGAEVGLVEAALLGDYTQVQQRLTAGANREPQDFADALRLAAQSGHTDVVALLLDYGAPIDAGDSSGRTALMQAAQFGRIATLRFLLERGADPNVASQGGVTALMASAGVSTRNNREAVELLLTYGARATVRTRNGWTALMEPCLFGDTAVVALLLQYGADPNVFTDAEAMEREEGCSTTNALMMATGNGHIEVVKLLIHYGADPLAKSNADISALDCARLPKAFKHEERQQILPLLKAAINHP